MNGFADQGMDEGAFGEKKGLSEGLRTFDAFRELLSSSFNSHPRYSRSAFPPISPFPRALTVD